MARVSWNVRDLRALHEALGLAAESMRELAQAYCVMPQSGPDGYLKPNAPAPQDKPLVEQLKRKAKKFSRLRGEVAVLLKQHHKENSDAKAV